MDTSSTNRFALLELKDSYRKATDFEEDSENANDWQEVKPRTNHNNTKTGASEPQITKPNKKPNGNGALKPHTKQLATLVIRSGTSNGTKNGIANGTTKGKSTPSINITDPFGSPLSTEPLLTNPWCGICYLTFPTKSLLQTHIKANAHDHVHFCNMCSRVFTDRNSLQNHVRDAPNHEVHCNLCLSAFKDRWGLRCHFENNYRLAGGGHAFACLVCLQAFETKAEMEKHLHTAKTHVGCDFCGKKFKHQNARDEHWRTTKLHRHCLEPGCEFDGKDDHELEQHLENEHFRCQTCKMVFPSQNKLTAHDYLCTKQPKVIQDITPFRCSDCNESFPTGHQLLIHEDECGNAATTNSSSDDNSHSTDYHTAPASFRTPSVSSKSKSTIDLTCPFCPNIRFPDHKSLVDHLSYPASSCSVLKAHPNVMLHVLGKWWYSPLYMDVSMHAQIRTGRVDLTELARWTEEGVVLPFFCRSPEGCGQYFARLKELIAHLEDRENDHMHGNGNGNGQVDGANEGCKWNVATLRLDKLLVEVVKEVNSLKVKK